jgi:hypothetical protein
VLSRRGSGAGSAANGARATDAAAHEASAVAKVAMEGTVAALAGHRSPAAGPACTLAPMPHARLPLDPSTMQTLFMPCERPRPLSAGHAAHTDEEESIGGHS